MTSNLKKIFEIKPDDWEKALSYENEIMSGGVFKVFSNVNPFVKQGNLQPTPASVCVGTFGGIIIRAVVPVFATSSKFYALGDGSKLYLIDVANSTITDVSAQITANTGQAFFIDRWKDKLIYSVDGVVECNTIPVSSASKQVLLTGLTGTTQPFCVGPDGNAYIGNQNNLAKLTVATGTASASNLAVAASLETSFIVKQILNDGRYLVWIADNQVNSGGNRNRCVVAFWDTAKSVFDQLYEFVDSKINSAEIVGDIIKIITPAGIYHCSFLQRPKLVVPFGGSVAITETPTTHNATVVHQGNFLLWGVAAGGTSNKVYALGNKLSSKPDRLFQPHTVTNSGNIDAIASDDTDILLFTIIGGSYAGYSLNRNATNNTSVANVAAFSLPAPFTFHHARVVLRNPITSGDSVSLKLLNSPNSSSAGQKTIKASETKTNTTDSGEQYLIFDHTSAGDGTDIKAFSEISDIELTTNVPIRSLQIWGTPDDERGSYA